MEWITIADWPGGTVSVLKELRATKDRDPEGLLARYAGETGDGLRIVAVWESKEAAERFFASMNEADAKRLAPHSGGVPTVSAIAAQATYVAPSLAQ